MELKLNPQQITKIHTSNVRNFDPKSEEYQKQLCKVSEEFAAWYIYEVFKKMYNTVQKGGLIQESFGERWFREMLLQQYALKSAKTDLKDISNMIYKGLGGKIQSDDVHSAKSLTNRTETLKLLNSFISKNQKSGE